jgi:hypothetical protein
LLASMSAGALEAGCAVLAVARASPGIFTSPTYCDGCMYDLHHLVIEPARRRRCRWCAR